jgi:hypothetical protein
MTSNKQELLDALANLQPFVPVVEEYRAYYDSEGWVTEFKANDFPDNGNWIHIPKDLYIQHVYQWLRVVDGKIIKEIPNNNHYFSLTRSDKGAKVVKNHAGLLLEPDETYEDVEYYDKRNN